MPVRVVYRQHISTAISTVPSQLRSRQQQRFAFIETPHKSVAAAPGKEYIFRAPNQRQGWSQAMAGGSVGTPVLYKLSDACKVWVGNGFQNFTIYATESAQRHFGSDMETLRSNIQKALNVPDNQKIAQPDNCFKVKINSNLGYVVYKLNSQGPKTATIFHYHWNYALEEKL